MSWSCSAARPSLVAGEVACRSASGASTIQLLTDPSPGTVKRSTVTGATCAAAGIIVGVVTLTGLGLKFSSIVIDYAGGSLALNELAETRADLLRLLFPGRPVTTFDAAQIEFPPSFLFPAR